jgi:membrane carboxypeptidase/penicillin-binding protein PbpC
MNPVPNVTATATNNGNYYETQTISLSASGGNTYRWTGPNNFTSTQQNPQIVNAKVGNSGEYKVTVTNAEGCTAVAAITIKVELITAIANEPFSAELQAIVYPNPSTESFTIDVIPPTGKTIDVMLQISDNLGRVLWRKQLFNVFKTQQERVNLSQKAVGTYFLQVQTEQKRLNKMIILVER